MSTPEEAAAILNDLSPGTTEQIATRIVECFDAGQRRSDGSMALHPSRERWYIADAYRLAKIILGDSDRRGWVCIRHRCTKHYDVPAQNTNEASGSECGGCIAEQRDEVLADVARLAIKLDALKAELVEAQNVARMNGAERNQLKAEVEALREELAMRLPIPKADEKWWFCLIGPAHPDELPTGSDAPMRTAVGYAFQRLLGERAVACFSGWGEQPTEGQRAVVANTEPNLERALARLDALRAGRK